MTKHIPDVIDVRIRRSTAAPYIPPTAVPARERPMLCDFCDRPAVIVTRDETTNAFGQPITITERYCTTDYELWGPLS